MQPAARRVTLRHMAQPRSKIESNLSRIRENIASACGKAGRSVSDVTLVAVTKSVEMPEIRTLVELGVTELGESRVQHLALRAAELGETLQRRKEPLLRPVRWHMIGHLQRNKIRQALDWAEVVHSVDSLRLAEEISVRAVKLEREVDLLLQVNCSQEEQKYGVAVGAASHLAEMISTLKNVRLVGLMTMAPLVDDPERARAAFVRLRELFEEMRRENSGGPDLRHLSMGMSQDYQVAIEEGATLIRIGTALFQ